MATINIKDIKLKTIIGTNAYERNEKQDIIINVSFDYDATKAIEEDNLNKAVDYASLTKKITKHCENSKYYLIEKLADSILSIIFEDNRIKKSSVSIDKPNAIDSAKTVNVYLER